MIWRKIAFLFFSDCYTGNCIGGRINNKKRLFLFFQDPFSKEHPFHIVNTDSYNVDIIMNCTVIELKID